MITLHPFQHEDFDILLELANQAVPFTPKENAEWLENRKAFDESRYTRRHYLAVDGGKPVGYGCLEQQGDDPKRLRVFVVCSPEHLQGEAGSLLYAQLMQDAKELGATRLWAREFQEDEPIQKFLLSRGFREYRRFSLPGQRPMVALSLDLAGKTFHE